MDKQAKKLVLMFRKKQEEVDGKPASINLIKAVELLEIVIADIGYDETKSLMKFYLSTNRTTHDINYFLYNYDKLYRKREAIKEDAKWRRHLQARTKKILDEDKNEQ